MSKTNKLRILAFAFVGLLGCDKSSSESDTEVPSEDAKASDQHDDEVVNLCTEYKSCDGCIAGQITKGKAEGEAETLCALAVTGCWTTWDKPVVCGEQSFDEQPS